jgi:hypothetical protein
MVRNFQNGKIYSIRSHQTEKIYIGSTTQSLSQRFSNHKFMTCSSREIMQFADAYIELIQMFPCANKVELQGREGEIIRTTDCVNKTMPGRTRAEYREDNKEEINQKQIQYNKDHKEERKQYETTRTEEMKQYRRTHKNIRKCSCGVEYNDGTTYHRDQHYSSKFHVQFVQDFYERLHQLLNRYTEVE